MTNSFNREMQRKYGKSTPENPLIQLKERFLAANQLASPEDVEYRWNNLRANCESRIGDIRDAVDELEESNYRQANPPVPHEPMDQADFDRHFWD